MRQQLGRQVVASYSVLVGIATLATWIFLLTIGDVPEAFERPFELTFHVVAEVTAAILLMTAGTGLFYSKSGWAPKLSLFSLGMLLYATISTIGAYLQEGNTSMVIVLISVSFSTIAVATLPLQQRNSPMDQKLNLSD